MKNYLNVIESFTQTLTDTKTVSEVCWEITKNVIAKIGFEDCVVYLYDEEKNVLVQMAAHGPKNPIDLDIFNPITITPGKGIVGSVFVSGQPEIIPDTRKDNRYIIDDQARLSEIAVPMLHNGHAIGVIDSEHSEAGFFTGDHLMILNTLAAIASNKIVKTRAFETLKQVNKDLEEKNKIEEEKNRELQLVNEQLDEIVYSLSHDFRSPILAAIGMSDVLMQHPEKIQQVFPMLNQSLRRVDGILINIHHFSLNLRRPVEVSQIVLQEWISDVYKNIKHPNKHEAIFNLDCDHSLSIHCDDYRLEVMVKQIFTNSLQFAKQADTTLQINVRITHHKGWVVMEIEDNGPGISEKDLLQLGTMFRRSSALSNGAGLGIFLCKEIAAKIGVEINWENKAEGGTRVKIEFV